jgi:NADPH:quinone reductase-like Zn-dependent oxidoreductase
VTNEVTGVVALKPGEPVSLETVLVPDPGPGEALVRVQACGVCHTDLHYREGGISDDFPFLLGHEAAGEVVSVGPDVRGLARAPSSSSIGALSAALAALVERVSRNIALPPSTQPNG